MTITQLQSSIKRIQNYEGGKLYKSGYAMRLKNNIFSITKTPARGGKTTHLYKKPFTQEEIVLLKENLFEIHENLREASIHISKIIFSSGFKWDGVTVHNEPLAINYCS
jgi:hypothetical protein